MASISPDAAETFLGRLDERSPDRVTCALGAFQDDGTLIGVAVLGAASSGRAWLSVAVAPDRRRLKIGSDLVHALAADAAQTGVRQFLTRHRGRASAVRGLARCAGLTIVGDDEGRTVIIAERPTELSANP